MLSKILGTGSLPSYNSSLSLVQTQTWKTLRRIQPLMEQRFMVMKRSLRYFLLREQIQGMKTKSCERLGTMLPPQVTTLLIAAGAVVNVEDFMGRTLLDLTEAVGNEELAQLLRQNGAIHGTGFQN